LAEWLNLMVGPGTTQVWDKSKE